MMATGQKEDGTVAELLLRRAADELRAMHEQYCPGCQGGCPTQQIIADILAVLAQTEPVKGVLIPNDTPDVSGYVESGGQGCPWCGADAQTEGDSVETGEGNASQEMGCHQCGRSWHDLYELRGIMDMVTPRYPKADPQVPQPVEMQSARQARRLSHHLDVVPQGVLVTLAISKMSSEPS